MKIEIVQGVSRVPFMDLLDGAFFMDDEKLFLKKNVEEPGYPWNAVSVPSELPFEIPREKPVQRVEIVKIVVRKI